MSWLAALYFWLKPDARLPPDFLAGWREIEARTALERCQLLCAVISSLMTMLYFCLDLSLGIASRSDVIACRFGSAAITLMVFIGVRSKRLSGHGKLLIASCGIGLAVVMAYMTEPFLPFTAAPYFPAVSIPLMVSLFLMATPIETTLFVATSSLAEWCFFLRLGINSLDIIILQVICFSIALAASSIVAATRRKDYLERRRGELRAEDQQKADEQRHKATSRLHSGEVARRIEEKVRRLCVEHDIAAEEVLKPRTVTAAVFMSDIRGWTKQSASVEYIQEIAVPDIKE
ncbi:MAG: hypothetical protein EOO38_07555, partial [Cytophagaceae bacterium]